MKKFTVIMAIILVVAAALIAPGYLAEHPKTAIALGVAGVLVLIGLALLAGVLIGGAWTRRTMQDGAAIALRAQQVNDEWDAKKTAAFAGLMREGANIGRQAPGSLPALPTLPGQGDYLNLPPLAEFNEARYRVIDNEEGQ